MKNIFVILITIFLMKETLAQEQIRIYFPFPHGSTFAALLRMTEVANRVQDTYKFLPETKPGASGSIAAVTALQNNALLLNTGSFIIRGLNGEETQYKLENFQPVFLMAREIPIVLVSKKYDNLNDLLRNDNLNIGTSSLNGIQSIVMSKIGSNYTPILYKNSSEIMTATIGKHIDGGITFIEEAKALINNGNVNLLGMTGEHGTKTFKSQNIKGLDNVYQHLIIYAPATMDKQKVKEINELFGRVGESDYVQELANQGGTQFKHFKLNEVQEWYNKEKNFYTKIIVKVK